MKPSLLFALTLLTMTAVGQSAMEIFSPSKKISIKVTVGDSIRYSVWYGAENIIGQSAIALVTDKKPEGELREAQVVGGLERGEDGELKGGISEREQGKDEPEALKAQVATEAIAQRNAHRVHPHDDQITAEHPEQRIENRGH